MNCFFGSCQIGVPQSTPPGLSSSVSSIASCAAAAGRTSAAGAADATDAAEAEPSGPHQDVVIICRNLWKPQIKIIKATCIHLSMWKPPAIHLESTWKNRPGGIHLKSI